MVCTRRLAFVCLLHLSWTNGGKTTVFLLGVASRVVLRSLCLGKRYFVFWLFISQPLRERLQPVGQRVVFCVTRRKGTSLAWSQPTAGTMISVYNPPSLTRESLLAVSETPCKKISIVHSTKVKERTDYCSCQSSDDHQAGFSVEASHQVADEEEEESSDQLTHPQRLHCCSNLWRFFDRSLSDS